MTIFDPLGMLAHVLIREKNYYAASVEARNHLGRRIIDDAKIYVATVVTRNFSH